MKIECLTVKQKQFNIVVMYYGKNKLRTTLKNMSYGLFQKLNCLPISRD